MGFIVLSFTIAVACRPKTSSSNALRQSLNSDPLTITLTADHCMEPTKTPELWSQPSPEAIARDACTASKSL